MSLSETVSIMKEAEYLKLPVGDIIVNKLYPENNCRLCRHECFLQARVLRELFLKTCLPRFALWGIPLHPEEVRGATALESLWDGVRPIREPAAEVAEDLAPPVVLVGAAVQMPRTGAALRIFAGKGGVGKTTLACATALRLAESFSRRVLLVSTGPAHSLSGCLDVAIEAEPKRILPSLTALEIDSQAEFEALKQQYAGDIEKFLESVSSNFDLAFDREVLERTLDLSPPGLDEVMGLTRVMALLASRDYDVLVLDSAATGHLIRLLELPEIIDQWLKAFFAVLLKYRQVFRLTEFSQKLVEMSKNLKMLRHLLRDPAGSALYAVSIPTQMAFEETRDLLAACGRLEIAVPGLFINLVTPASDCGLCSALNRRESLICERFKRSFHGRITQVYRHGEIRGLHALRHLGEALYQTRRWKTMAVHAR